MNDKTIKVQDKNTDMLLDKQGVQGTAVGKKMVNGKQTDDDAILVFVQGAQYVNGLLTSWSR